MRTFTDKTLICSLQMLARGARLKRARTPFHRDQVRLLLWKHGTAYTRLYTRTEEKEVPASHTSAQAVATHSLSYFLLTEPPQDLDLQMRTRTRPRWGPENCSMRQTDALPRSLHSSLTCRSYSSTSFEDAVKKAEEPPTPPPRPQKSHSRASSLDLNKLFQQGASGVCALLFLSVCVARWFYNTSAFTVERDKRGNADWKVSEL